MENKTVIQSGERGSPCPREKQCVDPEVGRRVTQKPQGRGAKARSRSQHQMTTGPAPSACSLTGAYNEPQCQGLLCQPMDAEKEDQSR